MPPRLTHPRSHLRFCRPLLEAQDLLELPSLLDAMQCCLLLLEPIPGSPTAAAAGSVLPSCPTPAESSSYDVTFANRAAAHMLSGRGARQGGSEPRSDQAEIPLATAPSGTALIRAEDRPLVPCRLREMGLPTRLSHYIPEGSMGVSRGSSTPSRNPGISVAAFNMRG